MINTEDARPEEVEKVDEMEKGWWYSEIHAWNFVFVFYFVKLACVNDLKGLTLLFWV